MEPGDRSEGPGLLIAAATIPYLTGPTASGKSDVAVAWAERNGGEIVSADSRQVYRELNVATAKPTPEERARVRHHLVDARSVREPLSAGAFAREAERCVRDILDRGRKPILVGGSTLYLQAIVFGLADIPPVDASVRERLAARLATEGAGVLFRALQEGDPAYAATLDPTKTQRMLRGLEVLEGTGRPLSSYFNEIPPPAFEYDIFVLTRPRAELNARIERRVRSMIESGLVEEARQLRSAGIDLDANPLRTIGYHEVSAYLAGECGQEDMVRRIVTDTRRYAKRQLTWLRRYPDATWIDGSACGVDGAVSVIEERAR